MQRLKTRPQFQAVLAGSIVARTAHFALHRNALEAATAGKAASLASKTVQERKTGKTFLPPALFPAQDMWIGAMVPKRWAKRAVTRNAIKRQVYTVSENFKHRFPEATFLVRLRKEFSRKEFPSATSLALKEAVRAELDVLMMTAIAGK